MCREEREHSLIGGDHFALFALGKCNIEAIIHTNSLMRGYIHRARQQGAEGANRLPEAPI